MRVLILIAAVAVMVGCGSSESSTPATSSTAPPAPSASTGPTPQMPSGPPDASGHAPSPGK